MEIKTTDPEVIRRLKLAFESGEAIRLHVRSMGIGSDAWEFSLCETVEYERVPWADVRPDATMRV